MLIETIEKVFKLTLGEDNAKILFNYLQKRDCQLSDIPHKLGFFSTELRRVFTTDENRLDRSCQDAPCSASILEETTLRVLCLTLSQKKVKLAQVHLDKLRDADFEQFISLLKDAYLARKGNMTPAPSKYKPTNEKLYHQACALLGEKEESIQPTE